MSSLKFELAGLTDLKGQLGKMVDGAAIQVPETVDVDEHSKYLCINMGERSRSVIPSKVMLDRFITLWGQPVVETAAFAREWGVFNIDQTLRPCSELVLGLKRREPILYWHFFSQRANALVNLAARLFSLSRRPYRGPEWEALGPISFTEKASPLLTYSRFDPLMREFASSGFSWACKENRRVQLCAINLEVDIWLQLGRVGLTVRRERDEFKLGVDYHGCLFSAIALQLALTVSRADSMFTCAGCGKLYFRTQKRPKPGQSNFCEECGRTEAVRHADRRRRERMKKARSMSLRGVSVEEIAADLGSREETVRKWIEER